MGISAWNELDYDIQEALQKWFNSSKLRIDDKRLLAALYNEGKFEYGECLECGDKWARGNPTSWDKFQGVHNDEGIGELCEECSKIYIRLKGYAQE